MNAGEEKRGLRPPAHTSNIDAHLLCRNSSRTLLPRIRHREGAWFLLQESWRPRSTLSRHVVLDRGSSCDILPLIRRNLLVPFPHIFVHKFRLLCFILCRLLLYARALQCQSRRYLTEIQQKTHHIPCMHSLCIYNRNTVVVGRLIRTLDAVIQAVSPLFPTEETIVRDERKNEKRRASCRSDRVPRCLCR